MGSARQEGLAVAHGSAFGEDDENERREPGNSDPGGIMPAVARARIARPTGPAGLRPQLSVGWEPRTKITPDLRARIGLDPILVVTTREQVLHPGPARLRKGASMK